MRSVIYFTVLMKDENKFFQDLEKIDTIASEIKKKNPEKSLQFEILWTVSPKSDGELDLIHQSLYNPTPQTQLEGLKQLVHFRQVFLHGQDFEQTKFLNNVEKQRFEETKLDEEHREKFKDSIYLNKGDSESYNTELKLRGNEQALSNILVSSVAEKAPGVYINLDNFSLDEAKKISERVAKNTPWGIGHDQKGNISYIRSTEANRERLQMINHERDERYKLLDDRIPKLQQFGSSPLLRDRMESVYIEKGLRRRLGMNPEEYTTIQSQNSIIDIYNQGRLTSNFTGEALVKDIESLQKPQKLSFFARVKESFKSLSGFKSKAPEPGKSHLIVYSDDRKSNSDKSKSKFNLFLSKLGLLPVTDNGLKAERLYKKDPKNSILYRHDPIADKLVFIKAGGIKNERQLQFNTLYKRAGFDRFMSYGDSLINPDKAAKLLSESGMPLRNNRLTPPERKAVEKIKTHLSDDMGIILHLLPNALEQAKKDEDFQGVDYKKIARHLLEERGESLFVDYKNDSGNRGVNGKDEFENSPLCTVAGSKELVEILVEDYQADVNIKDSLGLSPAFLAASVGKVDNLKYLQQNGADLHAKDHNGGNILYGLVGDHAPRANRDLTNTFRYLLEQGLDPNEKNKSGESAADFARKSGKYDLLELFEPLNLSVGIHNALSADTKEFFKSALLESHPTPQTQIAQSEPDYATIDELGLSVEDFSKPPTPQAQVAQSEPDYVDIDQIRFKKEFDRLNRINLENPKIDSGYASDDDTVPIDDSLLRMEVPGDGDCALHAIASAYLIPVAHDDRAFEQRFQKLFGENRNTQVIRDLMRAYDPSISKDNILYSGDMWKKLIGNFRQQLVDHMSEESHRGEYESSFVPNDPEDHNVKNFDMYLEKMRRPSVYWGDREIKAASDFLHYPIKVDKHPQPYNADSQKTPIYLFHVKFTSKSKEDNHYNFGLDKKLANKPRKSFLEQSQTSGCQDNLNRSSSSESLMKKIRNHRQRRATV